MEISSKPDMPWLIAGALATFFGHFFIIGEDDIFRLKYASAIPDDAETGNLTHTIIIESKKFNAQGERQSE